MLLNKKYYRITRTAVSSTCSPYHSSVSQTSTTELRSEISSILGPEKELVLTEKMHNIVSNFRNRAFSVRQKLEESASPEMIEDIEDTDDTDEDDKDDQTIVNQIFEGEKNEETPSDSKGLIEKLMEWV